MKKDDVGIWIDEREALLVTFSEGKLIIQRIPSEVETYHVTGGSGSSTPYGPQDAVSETGYLRRKNQQLKKYFSRVMEHLKTAERILIIGPAEAKDGLRKELSGSALPFERLAVKPADSMTENQLKARVKEFFKE